MPEFLPLTLALADLTSEQRLEAAKGPGVPQVYFNGYMTLLGIGDVTLVVERNGHPSAMINMSYTMAKSLALGLGQIVATLEEATGREMLTTGEVESKLSEVDKSRSPK